jgi:hypothetical protein
MERARLPETRTIEVVDTALVRDSNYRQHGKGAITSDYKHYGDRDRLKPKIIDCMEGARSPES